MAINQMSKRGSKRLSLGARQRPKKTNVKRLKSTEFIFLALLSFGLISAILSFLYYRSSVAFPFENILQQEAASLRIPTTRNKSLYTKSSTKSSNAPKSWWRGTGNVPNVTHPHLGARYWNAEKKPILQMILNPSPERLAAPKKNFSDTIKPEILCPNNGYSGIERKEGNDALLKVKSGIQKYNNRVNNRVAGEGEDEDGYRKTKSKILCMVYTVDTPKQKANLKAVAETWGQKCDGFFAASNVTDHSLGAIDLVHEGEEEYGNMWQKVRSMWAYAYDHYLEEYDFFHICGDDVYIAVENFRSFFDGPDVLRLENGYLDEISGHEDYIHRTSNWTSSEYYKDVHGLSARPLWFGNPACHRKTVFPCGGPGYTMNRAALELFVKVGLPTYLASSKDFREDIFMGGFFTQQGIILSHVTDRFNGTRYGEDAARSNLAYKKFRSCPGTKRMMERYGYAMADNLQAVSEEMSAFHLKYAGDSIPELIYRYHAVLYDLC